MAKHIVKCRVCKQSFDTEQGIKDVDWIMPSNLYYFHKKCYEEWKSCKDTENYKEQDWIDLIYDLIKRDLKCNYNFQMCEAQRNKFISQRMTNKGIYYTMFWHFYIKNNKWKEEYGLGIVPHVYEEATAYWVDKEQKKKGILKQILSLSAEEAKQEMIKLEKAPRKKSNIKMPD